jgi:hypothetical protein
MFINVSASVFSEHIGQSYDSSPYNNSDFEKFAKHCPNEFPSHCKLIQFCDSSVIVSLLHFLQTTCLNNLKSSFDLQEYLERSWKKASQESFWAHMSLKVNVSSYRFFNLFEYGLFVNKSEFVRWYDITWIHYRAAPA